MVKIKKYIVITEAFLSDSDGLACEVVCLPIGHRRLPIAMRKSNPHWLYFSTFQLTESGSTRLLGFETELLSAAVRKTLQNLTAATSWFCGCCCYCFVPRPSSTPNVFPFIRSNCRLNLYNNQYIIGLDSSPNPNLMLIQSKPNWNPTDIQSKPTKIQCKST